MSVKTIVIKKRRSRTYYYRAGSCIFNSILYRGPTLGKRSRNFVIFLTLRFAPVYK